MKGLKFIKQKQRCWAQRHGAELVSGTIGADGEKNYLQDIGKNLFEPLTAESAGFYSAGDGGETRDTGRNLAKMKAVHSSSAIVVNLFQYWQGKDVSCLLHALKASGRPQAATESRNMDSPSAENTAAIKFEQKFRICDDTDTFPRPANIDVVIEDARCHIAIESKFTEPYRGSHGGLREAYLDSESLWTELPNLHELAKQISPDNKLFRFLDAAQLIKHILGLSANYPKQAGALQVKFRLLYLWYDVLGEDGAGHRAEIERFAEIAGKDNVDFRHISYQEVIAALAENISEGNRLSDKAYVDYLTGRYL